MKKAPKKSADSTSVNRTVRYVPDEGKPNRRMVEQLLREIRDKYGSYRRSNKIWEQQGEIEDKIDTLRKRLLNNAELKALEKKRERLREKARNIDDTNTARLQMVRQQYLCGGVTEALLKQLQKMVAEINNEPC